MVFVEDAGETPDLGLAVIPLELRVRVQEKEDTRVGWAGEIDKGLKPWKLPSYLEALCHVCIGALCGCRALPSVQ